MIMPNKNIKVEYSLLNCGALILQELKNSDTLSSLWEKSKFKDAITSYEKFVLALDYLYLIGAIKVQDGLVMRCKND